MKAKKYLSLLLAMAMCLSLLAGCGSSSSSSTGDSSEGSASSSSDAATSDASSESSSESESTSTGTVRTTEDGRTKVIVGTTNNAGSFDPMLSDQQCNRKDEVFLVYETMVYMDSNGEYHINLAESYEQTSDNSYTVYMHDNIYDSAGNHITADDVIFCFAGVKAAGGSAATDGATCEKVDDYTVVYTMETEDPVQGSIETCLTELYIVSQAAYEASEDQMAATPVGTGAYVLTDFQSGVSLTFEVNENYWNKDGERCFISQANVDVIEFQIIGDQSQVAIALQAGTIDISDCVASSDAVYFEEGGEYADSFNIELFPKTMAMWLMYNCSDSSPLSNINLRKAIAYCFSTSDIISAAENGYAVEISSMFSTYSSYYNSEWDEADYYEYDAEVAQEYLDAFTEETGIAVSDLNLSILANANNSDTCELLGAYLTVLGIPYTLNMVDQTVVNTTLPDETGWDLFVNERTSTGYNLKVLYEYINDEAQSYGNIQFITDETLQEIAYDAAHVSTASQETVNALHDYVTEQCYIIGLYQRDKVIVSADWITEVLMSSGNIVPNGCTYAS